MHCLVLQRAFLAVICLCAVFCPVVTGDTGHHSDTASFLERAAQTSQSHRDAVVEVCRQQRERGWRQADALPERWDHSLDADVGSTGKCDPKDSPTTPRRNRDRLAEAGEHRSIPPPRARGRSKEEHATAVAGAYSGYRGLRPGDIVGPGAASLPQAPSFSRYAAEGDLLIEGDGGTQLGMPSTYVLSELVHLVAPPRIDHRLVESEWSRLPVASMAGLQGSVGRVGARHEPAAHPQLPPGEGTNQLPDSEQHVRQRYRFDRPFNRGAQGEVWRASRVGGGSTKPGPARFILKRLLAENGVETIMSGIREIYFGEQTRDLPNVARFVEAFNRTSGAPRRGFGRDSDAPPDELWLVFVDEGTSLNQLLYSASVESADGFSRPQGATRGQAAGGRKYSSERGASIVYERSPTWRRLRTEASGLDVFRQILRGLLAGVAELHSRDIVHRDLKPQNVILGIHDAESPSVRIADFGSAVDEAALNGMYGGDGPAQREETREYSPPEVLFDDTAPYFEHLWDGPKAYDLWSVGVIALEMVLGQPDVWTVDARLGVVVEQQIRRAAARAARESRASGDGGSSQHDDRSDVLDVMLHRARQLSALAEFCLFRKDTPVPRAVDYDAGDRPHAEQGASTKAAGRSTGSSAHTGGGAGARPGRIRQPPSSCGLADFNNTIRRRDPLGVGLGDRWAPAVRLIWQLLRWDPRDRLAAEEALDHAFFVGDWVCPVCGAHFDLHRDLEEHSCGDHTPTALPGYSDVQAVAVVPSLQPQDVAVEAQAVPNPPAEPVARAADKTVGFVCEGCGRRFELWPSCHRHSGARSHGACRADPAAALPPCEDPSAGGELARAVARSVAGVESIIGDACGAACLPVAKPLGDQAGWCGLQGRRAYMEDLNVATWVVLPAAVSADDTAPLAGEALASSVVAAQYYGVFDGHGGTGAAAFAAEFLHSHIAAAIGRLAGPAASNNTLLRGALHDAFADHEAAWRRTAAARNDTSGCTATVAMLMPTQLRRGIASRRLLVAHLGDSRAVRCCAADGRAIQLTVDHTPYNAEEYARVEAAGGFVEMNGVLRVQGRLAVTRSFGDPSLRQYLSVAPHVVFDQLEVPEASTSHNNSMDDAGFIILGSDGLWETLSNDDAVAVVKSVLHGEHPYNRRGEGGAEKEQPSHAHVLHLAARALAHEAFIRGSTDNVGAYVIDAASDRMAL